MRISFIRNLSSDDEFKIFLSGAKNPYNEFRRGTGSGGGSYSGVRPARPRSQGFARNSKSASVFFASSRHSTVKVSYSKTFPNSNGKILNHLKYITRSESSEKKIEVISSNFGDGENSSLIKFAKEAASDKHYFKIIISPEDGEKISMASHVENFMKQLEHDTQSELSWFSAIHYDTDNPHAHIVIRGRKANGKELRFKRNYIAYSMRAISENLVYKELGRKNAKEASLVMKAMVLSHSATRLDRLIFKSAKKEEGEEESKKVLNLEKVGAFFPRELVEERLRVLEKQGLAKKKFLAPKIWLIDDELIKKLFSLSLDEERKSLLRMSYDALDFKNGILKNSVFFLHPDPKVNYQDINNSVSGRIIRKGLLRTTSKPYVILFDKKNNSCHFVEGDLKSNNVFKEFFKFSELKVGSYVKLTAVKKEFTNNDGQLKRLKRERGKKTLSYKESLILRNKGNKKEVKEKKFTKNYTKKKAVIRKINPRVED